MAETTGGFKSADLERELIFLALPSFDLADAVAIGDIAKQIGLDRKYPISIEIRISDWIVYHASLPGSNPENDSWIARKARVVAKTGKSTMFERVRCEESGIDWYFENGVSETDYAIHGGGLPITTKGGILAGILLISGLPQVEDHLLGVEVLTEFLARKGELN